MMAAYALRPLLLYLHLYAQLVPRKPALDDPHTELLPAALDRRSIATPPFGCFPPHKTCNSTRISSQRSIQATHCQITHHLHLQIRRHQWRFPVTEGAMGCRRHSSQLRTRRTLLSEFLTSTQHCHYTVTASYCVWCWQATTPRNA